MGRLNLSRIMHKFSTAVPQSFALTVLRFLARLVSAVFSALRYKNLCTIQAKADAHSRRLQNNKGTAGESVPYEHTEGGVRRMAVEPRTVDHFKEETVGVLIECCHQESPATILLSHLGTAVHSRFATLTDEAVTFDLLQPEESRRHSGTILLYGDLLQPQSFLRFSGSSSRVPQRR